MTPNPNPNSSSTIVPSSRSLADIREEQAYKLECIRSHLLSVDPRDLVPSLVARHVINTADMGAIYSQVCWFWFYP